MEIRADSYAIASRFVQGCWIGFGVFWIIASFWTKRTAFTQNMRERLLWLLPLALATVILLKSPNEPYPLNIPLFSHDFAAAALAVLLCACGLIFTLWSRVRLGRNWSSRVSLKVGHELVQHG